MGIRDGRRRRLRLLNLHSVGVCVLLSHTCASFEETVMRKFPDMFPEDAFIFEHYA